MKFDAKEVSTIYIISKDAVSDHSMQSRVQQLVVGVDYIKLIWVPDTFFVNEKVAKFHAATQVGHGDTENSPLCMHRFYVQENQFLRITHKGEILRRY